uniref:Uncharacterized protein n=1 Tax=Steinernema glaseri TaxID=37863 RepID=A0A1I8AS34_9BILA
MGSAKNSVNSSSAQRRRSSVAANAKIASYRARMMSLRNSPRRKAELESAESEEQKPRRATEGSRTARRGRGRGRRATVESRHAVKARERSSREEEDEEEEEMAPPRTKFVSAKQEAEKVKKAEVMDDSKSISSVSSVTTSADEEDEKASLLRFGFDDPSNQFGFGHWVRPWHCLVGCSAFGSWCFSEVLSFKVDWIGHGTVYSFPPASYASKLP